MGSTYAKDYGDTPGMVFTKKPSPDAATINRTDNHVSETTRPTDTPWRPRYGDDLNTAWRRAAGERCMPPDRPRYAKDGQTHDEDMVSYRADTMAKPRDLFLDGCVHPSRIGRDHGGTHRRPMAKHDATYTPATHRCRRVSSRQTGRVCLD